MYKMVAAHVLETQVMCCAVSPRAGLKVIFEMRRHKKLVSNIRSA